MTEIPRRIDLERFTPAERAIFDAVQAVEAMAADVRLTDAVLLLQAARDSVADYIDNIGPSRRYVRAGDPPIENVRLFQHRAEVVEFVKEIRGYTMLTDAVDATIRILTRSAGEAIPVSSASAASTPPSVIEAAKAFVARLDVIHADPRYQWVWQNSQLHGGPYTGPSYADELTALRAALASQPSEAQK